MTRAQPGRVGIIGASLAGARAAETLRHLGYSGEILLVGEEPVRPYERPPLSKDCLLNDQATLKWIHSETFYAEKNIELITGCRVVGLKVLREAGFEAELEDGSVRHLDSVILATGGRPRTLAGYPMGGPVQYIRNWADSIRLRNSLTSGARVVVIGSGFIGAEVASSALARGCRVTMVEALPRLYPSIPSDAIAQDMADAFANAGGVSAVGESVVRISQRGAELYVHLASDSHIEADVVVAGIGIEANVELAVMAGAAVDRAVLVDSCFQTSVANLYAVGDVCTRMDDNGCGWHVEHWKAAQEHGAAVAHAILGMASPELSPTWCWSDQLDQRIEVAGAPRLTDEQIIRRAPGETVAFHFREGRLTGLVSLNAPRAMRMAMKLLNKSGRLDPDQLADANIPLNKIQAVV